MLATPPAAADMSCHLCPYVSNSFVEWVLFILEHPAMVCSCAGQSSISAALYQKLFHSVQRLLTVHCVLPVQVAGGGPGAAELQDHPAHPPHRLREPLTQFWTLTSQHVQLLQ